MSEMVKRLAKAMFEHRMDGDPFTRELICGNPPVPFEQLVETYRELFYAEARNAISAMREPTEAMSQAGMITIIEGPGVTRHIPGSAQWQLMIDEALK